MHFDEGQDVPSIHVIVLSRCFFLPVGVHAAGVCAFPSPFVARWGGQYAAIESHKQLFLAEAPSSEHPHQLFFSECADRVGQTLSTERFLFLFRGAFPRVVNPSAHCWAWKLLHG